MPILPVMLLDVANQIIILALIGDALHGIRVGYICASAILNGEYLPIMFIVLYVVTAVIISVIKLIAGGTH